MKAVFRRAKIVATVGPASWSPEVLRALIEAGADALRINFAHASHEKAAEIVSLARGTSQELGRPLAVMGDLRGPKLRVGELPGETASIEAGHQYRFLPPGEEASPGEIPTIGPPMLQDMEPGARLLLDDGRLEFMVERLGPAVGELVAEAENSGILHSGRGINLPGTATRLPPLTESDREAIAFANDASFDFLALSFVRKPKDLETVRELMASGCLLIAKIEKPQALERLPDVMGGTDCVMVARGDLGVELPFEEVPLVQKRIIRMAQERVRPVITATQMLESMIDSKIPTRAEVSDVANALLDGTDAVMLSAETAVGANPVAAVEVMDTIIRRIEGETLSPARPMPGRGRTGRHVRGVADIQQTTSGAIAAAAVQAVGRLDAPLLVTFTRSGHTARMVAAQRPHVPVMAMTDQQSTYNQLALVWGVKPVLFSGEISYEAMLTAARRNALAQELARPGERLVVTAGVPFHVPGTTNMMRIEKL